MVLASALVFAGEPAHVQPGNGQSGNGLPGVAELAQRPIAIDPILAPDGRWIAYRDVEARGAQFILLDLSAPGRATRTIDLGGKHRLDWLRWAGSGRLIASITGPERRDGKTVHASHLLAIDVATGKRIPLEPGETSEGDGVLHVDPKGGFLLLASHSGKEVTPSVFRVDLATGHAEQIVRAESDVWDWFADTGGVIRAGMGVNGKRSWMLYRSGDGERFRTSRKGAGDLDSGIDRFVAVHGSDHGFAMAAGPAGRVALFRYDFRQSRLGELVYAHPRVDLEGFQVSPAGELLSVDFVDDREETLWFDAELRGHQAAIDVALPNRVNRVVSISDDKQRLLIFSRSPTDPGTYYIHDAATGTTERLMAINPAAGARDLARMEPVRYRARDGLEIRGYLTLPQGRDARDLPLVVLPHGGPFARDDWGYDPWVQYLAAKGYAVLQPNFRGSTGFGKQFVHAGDGEWGRGMQDDIDDGVRWLAERGTVDLKRVCIMGASFGGYAAMWAAARNPDLYRCAISFAGISDVAAQLAYDRKTFAPRYFKAWQRRIQGSAASLDALSPIHRVGDMTVPMLIAHGSEDETVPVAQSAMLHEALTREGRAHDYVVYSGEGHDLEDPANKADLLTRIGAFLDAHNPS